jgi:hypothetical protein
MIFSAMVSVLISGTWSNVYVFAQHSSLPWSPYASLQQPSSDDSGSNTPGWTTLTTAASKPLPIAPQQLTINQEQQQQPQLLNNNEAEIQGYTSNSPVVAQDKLMYLGYHSDSANNNDSTATKTSSSTSDVDHRSSSSDSDLKHKPDSNDNLQGNSAASKSSASQKGHRIHSGDGANRDSFFNADTFLSNIDLS